MEDPAGNLVALAGNLVALAGNLVALAGKPVALAGNLVVLQPLGHMVEELTSFIVILPKN